MQPQKLRLLLVFRRILVKIGALCLPLIPAHPFALNDGALMALHEAANPQHAEHDVSHGVSQLGLELVIRFFHQLALTGSPGGVIGRPQVDDSKQKAQLPLMRF